MEKLQILGLPLSSAEHLSAGEGPFLYSESSPTATTFLTRKLPSWVKGLLHRNLTATISISTNGTGMELLWLLEPEVVCKI